MTSANDKERRLSIGDRVCHQDGGVGYVEALDDDPHWPNADVRWQTPNNVPSCVISLCSQTDLTIVSDNVLPQPRSKEWKRKSREFFELVRRALKAEREWKP